MRQHGAMCFTLPVRDALRRIESAVMPRSLEALLLAMSRTRSDAEHRVPYGMCGSVR